MRLWLGHVLYATGLRCLAWAERLDPTPELGEDPPTILALDATLPAPPSDLDERTGTFVGRRPWTRPPTVP